MSLRKWFQKWFYTSMHLESWITPFTTWQPCYSRNIWASQKWIQSVNKSVLLSYRVSERKLYPFRVKFFLGHPRITKYQCKVCPSITKCYNIDGTCSYQFYHSIIESLYPRGGEGALQYEMDIGVRLRLPNTGFRWERREKNWGHRVRAGQNEPKLSKIS